ncbi:DnaJ domain-containing protein [Xanthomonadaceae bacterium JHOS43]|nr:DnaJ domain-containing protein [Xanthomonadaceae bacterium JHOS43]MCX7562207.1 DnaJ domain-containing protein [Xanthomonadaceae bacterium XH05]
MNFSGRRYYGKVLGGLLGFALMRHPIGLLFGAIIGHAFDAGWLRRQRGGPTALSQAYDELDVPPDASDEAIDAAYRRLMSRYHPDRVADAAEDVRLVAEERARAINAAYDTIMHARRKRQ